MGHDLVEAFSLFLGLVSNCIIEGEARKKCKRKIVGPLRNALVFKSDRDKGRKQAIILYGMTTVFPHSSLMCYHTTMASTKIGVSLPAELVAFADEEAARRGTSRSGLLASLLKAEQIREQTRQYLDKHGWDVTEDEQAWREYQRQRMAEEYSDDQW